MKNLQCGIYVGEYKNIVEYDSIGYTDIDYIDSSIDQKITKNKIEIKNKVEKLNKFKKYNEYKNKDSDKNVIKNEYKKDKKDKKNIKSIKKEMINKTKSKERKISKKLNEEEFIIKNELLSFQNHLDKKD